ncbi:MAG TPA: polyisoprenoid-binding protein [Caldithrix abyssi]|uniref:Polyisoprenoid-binding protein n=1 Tax=Caldithrix abyssi TaxID=187145 RepID=A0A7V1LL36_CALAY|nr:polyisoprenoid-binding protein [Caldithrix abyssi]
MYRFMSAALLLLSLGTMALATDYVNDKSHTTIGFEVTHMVISTVEGEFKDYDVSLTFDPQDLSKFNVEANIKLASVDTDNLKRDNHLRSPDFFNAEKYPLMTFKSSKVEKTDNGYVAIGTLTLHGITKDLRLPFTVKGPIKDPWGNTRIGINATTIINRKDFNVSWSKTMDGGGLVVSDDVRIVINAEFIRKK